VIVSSCQVNEHRRLLEEKSSVRISAQEDLTNKKVNFETQMAAALVQQKSALAERAESEKRLLDIKVSNEKLIRNNIRLKDLTHEVRVKFNL
jgi:hypothetical protein